MTFKSIIDEIETLRTFDIESQRTINTVQAIKMLPAHEYPLTPESISHFRS